MNFKNKKKFLEDFFSFNSKLIEIMFPISKLICCISKWILNWLEYFFEIVKNRLYIYWQFCQQQKKFTLLNKKQNLSKITYFSEALLDEED